MPTFPTNPSIYSKRKQDGNKLQTKKQRSSSRSEGQNISSAQGKKEITSTMQEDK